MTNITEIANELGISPSTVSRAIKKPDMVSLATRQQVLHVAEKLGYLKQLREDVAISGGTSNLVGVIVSDLTNSFSNQILKAVHDYLLENNFTALVGCSYEDPSREASILKQWLSLNLAGVIVMPTAKLSQTLKDNAVTFPVVLVDRDKSGQLKCDCVIEDNQNGMKLALEYLHELGHQKISIISGSSKVYTFEERIAGAKSSSVKAEIIELKAQSYDELFVDAFEQTNILTMRPKGQRPTAIIGANNAITSGILYALNLKGFNIPKDISVLSYGDSNWCRFYPTPITSIAQPTEELGVMAAKALVDRLNGKNDPNQRVCLKSMLLRRASTSAPTA